jgi:hypothetical protein
MYFIILIQTGGKYGEPAESCAVFPVLWQYMHYMPHPLLLGSGEN